MSAVDVMPLGPADLEEVVALWQAAGLTRPWNDPRADFLAAVRCSTATVLGIRAPHLVATAMAGFDGHRGWLYYLAVAEERRGQGLGRALVHAVEKWLVGQGAPKVQLMVRNGNDAGGFYRVLGYEDQPVAVFGKRLEGN